MSPSSRGRQPARRGSSQPVRASIGWVGAATGMALAGAVVGAVVERRTVHKERDELASAGQAPFGSVRGEPRTVFADDGVLLHVEVHEAGAPQGAPTIILSHGYTLTSEAWHYQRIALADLGRVVVWDHRGHGRSGRGARETAAIDQLGEDLRAVVDQVAPEGPLVLVGHSMGGMTIMALADAHPVLFKERVRGVGLVSTSSGKLADVTFGAPAALARVLTRVAPGFLSAASRRSSWVERGRALGSDFAFVATRHYAFGSQVSASLVEFSAAMIESTPVEVVADFYPAFGRHDKLEALGVLHGIETVVIVGEDDLLTPPTHARAIADALPHAELVVIPHCGHLSMLEHPDVVDQALRGMIERGMRE